MKHELGDLSLILTIYTAFGIHLVQLGYLNIRFFHLDRVSSDAKKTQSMYTKTLLNDFSILIGIQ